MAMHVRTHLLWSNLKVLTVEHLEVASPVSCQVVDGQLVLDIGQPSITEVANNNCNNLHLSCAHQRPERSHDTY